MHTINSSRQLSREAPAAMRAAEAGPVDITEHGCASHVLLAIEGYDRITGKDELMGDRLWRNQDPAVELDLPTRRIESARDGAA